MAKPTHSEKTKVTRIKASDTAPEKQVAIAKKQSTKTTSNNEPLAEKTAKKTSTKNPFVAFWRYLVGSWRELQQVRWPDRASTLKMTGALILFTVFFAVVILLIDYGFSQLFKLIMGTN